MKNLNQSNPSWPGLTKFRLFSFILHLTPYTLRHAPITVLLVLLSLSPARADDFFAVKDKVLSESSFKLGFLYFSPMLMLENVGYTSSIYTYEAKETPDWTGDLGLGLRASAIIANRLILQAEDLPHYSFYLENNNLRAWSNRFLASAYSYVGPFNLKAGFARNNLRQRPNLEFSRPYHYSDNKWSGAIDIGRSSNLFLTTYAEFNELDYDKDPYLGNFNLANSLNHRETVFGLKLNRRVFTSTVIYLNYQISDYGFTANSERNGRSQTMGLGVEFPEIGNLQGSFQIGLRRFDPKNPLFQSRQGLSGRGDVRVTLFERLHCSLFYALGTNFSYNANDLFYTNQSLGGGVEIYLTSFLKAGSSYEDGRLKYYSFLDLALQRSDRIRIQRYYLAVPFFGNTSLGFAYNIYRLSSDFLKLDYTRSYWGGYISYEF
jgi:hypothetical protein